MDHSWLVENLTSALEALQVNRVRSMLTMSGIIIGVALVIILVSLGESAKLYVSDMLGGMGFGANALVLHPGKMDPPIEPSKLSYRDALEIKKRVRSIQDVVPFLMGSGHIRFGKEEYKTAIWGLTENYPTLVNFSVADGKFMTKTDVAKHRKVCIIGATVKEKLFHGFSPVGENVRVAGKKFHCLGVMEPKGEMLGFNLDDMVIVPITTAQDILDTSKITEIAIWADSVEAIPAVKRQTTRLLMGRHFKQDDFHFHTQTEMLNIMGKITETLTLFVSGIAGISLLVGCIGIMNIMLVTVMERTREIGIRKAIGARDQDIFLQFFFESLVVSLGGGSIGIVAGIGLAVTSMNLIGMPIIISRWAIYAAVAASGLVGLIAGVYPAMKAARQDPIQALRHE